MKRLTHGSLFDGIGGFTLAAQRCGIKTLWASEIETACVEITKRHFPTMLHLGDITKINGAEIPPADIISFGSPCQDLSVGGHQIGLEGGGRSSLFLEAVRIIFEMRCATNGKFPTFVIWENVPGAFNSNRGYDFRTVIEKITKTRISIPKSGRWATAGMAGGCAGGANIAWRQLDSQFWGVPQRRKRIFLVGDFGGNRAGKILFECESLLGYVRQSGAERNNLAADTGSGIEAQSGLNIGETVVDFGRAGDRVRINANKSATIIATDGGGGAATGLYLFPVNEGVIYGDANGLGIGKNGDPAPTLTVRDRHGIALCYAPSGFGDYKESEENAGTLRASAGAHGRSSANLLLQIYETHSHGSYKESDGKAGGTLRASGGDYRGGSENIVVKIERLAMFIKYVLRKLTPLECERLQGFPDYWTKYTSTGAEIADTPRYTAIGNSLSVPCAERVFRGIVAVVRGGTGIV